MKRIAFVIDPLNSLGVQKDSTLAMMWAAQRRGWDVSTLQSKDLSWERGQVFLSARRTELADSPDKLTTDSDSRYQVGATMQQSAGSFDIVFMRKDPPFDMNYINTTYLLEQAEEDGVLVVNKPSSLRDCNEKFYTTTFPNLLPPQIVASRIDVLTAFHDDYQDVVFKPLDGMGGKGIFRVKHNDPNLNVILETLTQYESTAIVGQQFIPEIRDGDKRILLIDGEPVPYSLARIPKAGESRGNLAAGGVGVARPLTARDREIAEAVKPDLINRGLIFTGIDVIGDWLTEVNVTCPTCIRELDRECGLDIAMDLLDCLEAKIS